MEMRVESIWRVTCITRDNPVICWPETVSIGSIEARINFMGWIVGRALNSYRIAMLHGPVESFPTDTCLDEWIAAQAKASPDKIAVVADNGALTYAELDARAAELASLLRSLGV